MSFMSKVAELYFRMTGYKKMTADPVRRAEYIEKLRAINRKRVEAPRMGIRSEVTEEMIAGCETYYLNRGCGRALLYLHGGSYCEQPVLQHWQFCDRMAREADATAVMAIYKKAPDHSFEEAYAYLTELWKKLTAEFKPESITLMGDSAGGGLALGFAEYLNAVRMPQPGQIILFSPWLDLSMETEIPEDLDRRDPSLSADALRHMGKNWAGTTDVHDYRLSPIFGDLSGLAPLTVYFGTDEIFLPDGRRFRNLCNKKGIGIRYIEGYRMNHCYPLYPIPEAKEVQREVAAMIKGQSRQEQEKPEQST
ncbi:MAG: alpha/beta hydrolase [Oscillospiraceae bacterium]|nr:alpha/beta hydrolase [Oscillospiraceae bacterium]